jgi:hypothetical protein
MTEKTKISAAFAMILHMAVSDGVKISAVIGNAVFIGWVLFNGLDSGWKGTPAEIASYIALILLLVVNTLIALQSLRRQ